MNLTKKAAWILLIAFIIMQFIRPDLNLSKEPVDDVFRQETNPPVTVLGILEQSCYNCHSNHTDYPWYNSISPLNYWISDHIENGKGQLNFSEWAYYDERKKYHKLDEIIESVESAEMPLMEYTWTHESAKLSNVQKQAVVEWAKKTRLLYQLGQKPQ